MRFLITNDDGIDAPGIAALYESIRLYAIHHAWPSLEIWVVAPDRGRSECSHSVTTSRDLELREVHSGWYSVDGTPVDCVRVALTSLCPDVDAVFSGINAGANVGIDLLVSGTFAAAREAAILGKPSMAISHYRRPDVAKTWDHAPRWLGSTLTDFLTMVRDTIPTEDTSKSSEAEQSRNCSEGSGDQLASPPPAAAKTPTVWNVNLPALDPNKHKYPQTAMCHVDQTPMRRTGHLTQSSVPTQPAIALDTIEPCSPRMPDSSTSSLTRSFSTKVKMASDFHGRPRSPGSDVDQCFSGSITISKIHPKIG